MKHTTARNVAIVVMLLAFSSLDSYGALWGCPKALVIQQQPERISRLEAGKTQLALEANGNLVLQIKREYLRGRHPSHVVLSANVRKLSRTIDVYVGAPLRSLPGAFKSGGLFELRTETREEHLKIEIMSNFLSDGKYRVRIIESTWRDGFLHGIWKVFRLVEALDFEISDGRVRVPNGSSWTSSGARIIAESQNVNLPF